VTWRHPSRWGRFRAGPFRFHPIAMSITSSSHHEKTPARGVAPRGTREVQFVIARRRDHGRRVRRAQHRWWDVDPRGVCAIGSSGARVGALLQALIALRPAEQRPVIRAWLPSGFLPHRSRSFHRAIARDTTCAPLTSSGDVSRLSPRRRVVVARGHLLGRVQMSTLTSPIVIRSRFGRAWEVTSDLLIATALIWALPLLIGAAAD